MWVTIAINPAAQPAVQGILQQPILLAAIITFAGVLLTVVIGTLANFKLAQKRNEFEEKLAEQKLTDEKQARRDARSATIRLRDIEFQRATLLSLQEAVNALIVVSHDEFANLERKTSGVVPWEDATTDPSILDRSRDAFATVAMLTSRVRDDKLREAADGIRNLCAKIGPHNSEEVSKCALDEATQKYRSFNPAVGERIRLLEEQELATINGAPASEAVESEPQ